MNLNSPEGTGTLNGTSLYSVSSRVSGRDQKFARNSGVETGNRTRYDKWVLREGGPKFDRPRKSEMSLLTAESLGREKCM